MKKLTGLVLLFFTAMGVADAQDKDAQLWSWVSVEKKIAKNLTGALEEQVRLSQNMSYPKNIFTEASLGYRFNKHIKYTVCYRFMTRGDREDGFDMGNRFSGDLRIKLKKKPFVFTYRNRIQRWYKSGESGMEHVNYVRNKFAVAMDFDKKYSPFISFETYYHANLEQFDKNRYTLGVDFDLKKRNELSVFYRLQQEYNKENAGLDYIIGIGLSHRLKKTLFKKKKKVD